MIRIILVLMRIAVFVVLFYIIYSVYKSFRKPNEKKTPGKNTPCPSPKVFIDYTEGRIKGNRKKALDSHIAHCKNCQDALGDVFDIPKKKEKPR